MVLADVFDCFVKQSPFAVMMRAALENVLSADRLDAIFAAAPSRQRSGELLFSTVADLMGSVVTNIHPSVNAAHRAKAAEIGVSVKAVYDKLKGIEPAVCRSLVRETARHMAAIIEKTGGKAADLLPGYRVKIVDGNHLRRTDRRIEALRHGNVAPLPGKSLVVFDPSLRLAIDVLPCEDGHAQERRLLPELVESIEPGDVWFADRNFCTTGFLSAFFAAGSHFVIRQHGQTLSWQLEGRRKKIGQIETGVVFEQVMQMVDADHQQRPIRRITVKLRQPTRDGDDEIHVLTNLSQKVNARKIAELYRQRWTIETAFQEMAENLQGEINALGYPKAALFGFCMALVSYNVLSVTKAAVSAAHGEEAANALSTYYVADEIAATYRGMMIVITASFWTKRFAALTPAKMARALIDIAKHAELKRYQKNPWTPKQRTKRNGRLPPRKHVATVRVLEKQKVASASHKIRK
jgi:hypothetical protein